MPYYKICPLCNACLDPQEKCTCIEDKIEEEKQKEIDRLVTITMNMLKNQQKRSKK